MILPRYRVEIKLKNFLNIARGLNNFRKLNSDKTLYFNSGSEAILFCLNSLGNEKKITVGVPLYACSSIYQSIKCTGHKIKFLDIALTNISYNFNLEVFKDIDVLIFIHYFGVYYQNFEKIKSELPALTIIEDCSHISFMKYRSNNHSDAAIFSFNFHKPIVSGSGGAIYLNNVNLLSLFRDNYSKLPQLSWSQTFKLFLKIFIKNFGFNSIIYTLLFKKISKRRASAIPMINQEIKCFKISFVAKFLIGNNINNNYSWKENYLKISLHHRLNVNKNIVNDLSYFPVFFSNEGERNILRKHLERMKIDGFVLWENALLNSTFYGLESYKDYILTLEMLHCILFLPESLLKNRKKLNRVIILLNGPHHEK